MICPCKLMQCLGNISVKQHQNGWLCRLVPHSQCKTAVKEYELQHQQLIINITLLFKLLETTLFHFVFFFCSH